MNGNSFGRSKRIAQLIAEGHYNRLLDVGCYDGKELTKLQPYVKECYGIDPEIEIIKRYRQERPDLHLEVGVAEKIPHPSHTFDVIVFSDVLEHVENEIASFDEMYRVLKKNGDLLLTTPHQGLFAWLDPLNYGYRLKQFGVKKKSKPFHRHYSLADIKYLLNQSAFNKHYEIVKLQRTGLLIGPLLYNIEILSSHILSSDKAKRIITPFKATIGEVEYNTEFGSLAYYISLVIRKI